MAYKDNITDYGFGQIGSLFADGTGLLRPPTGKVFVAITIIADSTFDSHGGLVADQDSNIGLEYISTEDSSGNAQTAHDANSGSETTITGSGGLVVDISNVFPRGLTMYGRWKEINLATGTIIAYIGE